MTEHGDRGPPPHPKKPGVMRIWMDGCFDMMHFGHANAMRQAHMLGYELAGGPPTDDERERLARVELYVGVHTDAEIELFKGCLPCMTAEERYTAVRAVKWVTHVVEAAPYCTEMSDVERYDIDYVVHGDDLSVGLDGQDSYAAVKAAGKMKLVKRTDGVSTTDIINRMLLAAKNTRAASTVGAVVPASTSRFVATTRKLAAFSSGRQPTAKDVVVYVDGSFDIFHDGHVSFLRKAKEAGTFLVVGVHDDASVTARRGPAYPIMNVYERVMSVLACRYIDEVVICSTSTIHKEVLESLKVSKVLRGRPLRDCDAAAYAVPVAMGIFDVCDSGCSLKDADVRTLRGQLTVCDARHPV